MPRPLSLVHPLILAPLLSLSGCWANQQQWKRDDITEEVTRRDKESEAEALYRAGVNCMDNMERAQCATRYFEQLVELDPPERAMVSDAMFRLITLYQRDEEREEDATLLMRKFWDAGMSKGSRPVLPYTARYMPKDIHSVYGLDMERLMQTRLVSSLSAETMDWMFTCDEARREELRERRRKAKEKEKAAAPAPTQKEEKREAAAEERREEREAEPDPIYEDGTCQVATALGLADAREFSRAAYGQNHEDPTRSIATIKIPKLADKIAAAEAEERIAPEGDRLWSIAGASYLDGKVLIAKLDRNELVLMPESMRDEVMGASAGAEMLLNEQIQELAENIPEDATFYTVVSKTAIADMMDEAGPLGKMLPEADGMLFSVVVYDYAGLFIRVPTKDAVKASLLVNIVRWALRRSAEAEEKEAKERGEEADPDPALQAMKSMDVNQAPNGKALQMTTVLAPITIERIFRFDADEAMDEDLAENPADASGTAEPAEDDGPGLGSAADMGG